MTWTGLGLRLLNVLGEGDGAAGIIGDAAGFGPLLSRLFAFERASCVGVGLVMGSIIIIVIIVIIIVAAAVYRTRLSRIVANGSRS